MNHDSSPRYPSLYQINTRVHLTELFKQLRRSVRLDDIPDAELERLAGMGVDWVRFLSVWQAGPAGQRVSRTNAEWRKGFQERLPDLSEELVQPEVLQRTSSIPARLFWPDATRRVREKLPGFCLMPEGYWNMEWKMQQQGFAYASDKRLNDRLRKGHARPVREHFRAGLDYQNKPVRFLKIMTSRAPARLFRKDSRRPQP